MRKENFNTLLDEKVDEIQKISKEIDYSKLIYHYITPGIKPTNAIEFRGPLHIFKEIKNGDKTIQIAEKEQIKLKSKLGEVKSWNPDHKLQNQKDTIKNVQNLYNSRQTVTDLFNNYSKIKSKAIYETKKVKQTINQGNRT